MIKEIGPYYYHSPFAKWAVFSPNADAASRTSAIAASSSGVISGDDWSGIVRVDGAPCGTNATTDEKLDTTMTTNEIIIDFIVSRMQN